MTFSYSLIFVSILAVLGLALLISFFVKKRDRETHFQSKIVNDTSYNIGANEATSDASPEKTKEYLERKSKDDGQPLNRGDYEVYNDKV